MGNQLNVAWSNSNPAAEAGKKLAKIQQTGVDPVVRSIEYDAPIHAVQLAIDGAGAALTTGIKGAPAQYPFPPGRIVGWYAAGGPGETGSISVAVLMHASSAPPATPSVPTDPVDKISASAPIAISSANSASGDAAAVSTWLPLDIDKWDVFLFKVAAVSGFTKAIIILWIQEN